MEMIFLIFISLKIQLLYQLDELGTIDVPAESLYLWHLQNQTGQAELMGRPWKRIMQEARSKERDEVIRKKRSVIHRSLV